MTARDRARKAAENQRPRRYLELSDFAAYTSEDVRRYDNQRAEYHRLVFLLGRQRMAAGDTEEARDLLGRVPPEHPYAPHAKKCLAMMPTGGW